MLVWDKSMLSLEYSDLCLCKDSSWQQELRRDPECSMMQRAVQVSLWSPCCYSEVWQSAEEEHFALMGKVWAEGILSPSNSFLHSLPFSLLHPFLSSSSFLIFCCPCYFFSFLPWVKFSWALHSGITWRSGPPVTDPEYSPSPSAGGIAPVAKFEENKNTGCHSHPLPLRKAFLLQRVGTALREQNFDSISSSLGSWPSPWIAWLWSQVPRRQGCFQSSELQRTSIIFIITGNHIS